MKQAFKSLRDKLAKRKVLAFALVGLSLSSVIISLEMPKSTLLQSSLVGQEDFNHFYAKSLAELETLNTSEVGSKIVFSETESGTSKFTGYKIGKISADRLAEKAYELKQKEKTTKTTNNKTYSKGIKTVRNREADAAVYRKVKTKAVVGLREEKQVAQVDPNKRLQVTEKNTISLDEVENNKYSAKKAGPAPKPEKKMVARSSRNSAVQTVILARRQANSSEEVKLLRSGNASVVQSQSRIKTNGSLVSLDRAYALRNRVKPSTQENKNKQSLRETKRVSAIDTLRAGRSYRTQKEVTRKETLAKALDSAPEVVIQEKTRWRPTPGRVTAVSVAQTPTSTPKRVDLVEVAPVIPTPAPTPTPALVKPKTSISVQTAQPVPLISVPYVKASSNQNSKGKTPPPPPVIILLP